MELADRGASDLEQVEHPEVGDVTVDLRSTTQAASTPAGTSPASLAGRTRDPVAVRLLSLLGAFQPGDRSLTLTELARRTGLPQPTALRLLRALCEWGALERTSTGAYQIGLRMFHVGMLAPLQRTLREVALPFMQDLCEATRENVLLGVIQNDSVLYVEKIKGQRSATALTRSGGLLPVHATAIGKVILAFGSVDKQNEICDAPLRKYTGTTLHDGGALRADLVDTRLRGYAVANQELRPGRVSVAAPVLDYSGTAVAGLAVMGNAKNIDVMRVAPAVKTAALSLSRQLTVTI